MISHRFVTFLLSDILKLILEPLLTNKAGFPNALLRLVLSNNRTDAERQGDDARNLAALRAFVESAPAEG